MDKNLVRTNTGLQPTVKGGVVLGDIARVPADCLVTAINSGGMWFGGIDGVIQRAAGNMFHAQAQAAMPLNDGDTVVARKTGTHRGAFGDVVFVVDDLKRPLREVIFRGLQAADQAGYRKVSLPAIRMGVMLGVVERTVEEAGRETAAGIQMFLESNPANVRELTFVVYNDATTQRALQTPLTRMLPAPDGQ